jgi:predicted lipid-binding transport protein (Tim44 family)
MRRCSSEDLGSLAVAVLAIVTIKQLLQGGTSQMKKILTMLSVLAVAVSLSMPVFAQESSSSEAPATQTATKKHAKKHAKAHKKAKKAKKEMKKETSEGQN